MCRACDETPDGAGRRCNRPDGFTSVESDQRNRIRNLANARDALNRGDAQGAANAVAHALAAQQSLDGGGQKPPVSEPTDTEGPHKDFIVNPSDIDKAQARIDALNKVRENQGRSPLHIEVTRQHKTVAGDPILAWEQGTLRVGGAPEEELAKVNLGRGVRTSAEKRVNTAEVLTAACAATRLNGGTYSSRKEAGEDSVPAMVDAYIADTPAGPVRARMTPTEQDRQMANGVRAWAKEQPATSDYMRSVRYALAEDHMPLREAGTASSAVSGYLRYRERQAMHNNKALSPRPGGSRWLNQPGDKVIVTARVARAVPVYHEKRPFPRYLYIMRTPDGDLVKWMAPETQGLQEGDDVTLKATVKGHSTFNGEKQTEVHNAKQPQIHPRSA